MSLRTLRQTLKACADDTRLRIINLLTEQELTVKDICAALTVNQSTISKHLSRLRLLRVVSDRREGNFVYYTLNKNQGSPQGKVLSFLTSEFQEVKAFAKDKEALKEVHANSIKLCNPT